MDLRHTFRASSVKVALSRSIRKDAFPHFSKPALRFKPKRRFPVKKTAPQIGNVIDFGIFVYAFMEYLMDGNDLANMHLAVRLNAIPGIRKRIFFRMIQK